MPHPSKGESKQEFMHRCVPALMDEGREQKQALAICFKYWEKGPDEGLELVGKIDTVLNEMALDQVNIIDVQDLHSGMFRHPNAIDAVGMVRNGSYAVRTNSGSFVARGPVRGNSLEAGMIILGSYNKYNQGADIYEVLGFTGDKHAYGAGGVEFRSARDVLNFYGVNSLKALEELQDKNEYGFQTYLVVKDLHDNESGPWFYLFEGRWSRGSGAEALSFTLMDRL